MNSIRKTVVVMADDDQDDCMFAGEAFMESRIDGEFQCVEDGVELLDYLRNSVGIGDTPVPALILLDLNMPRKDGRQVLKEIKSTPVLEKIPVVVLTTSREEKEVGFIIEMGAKSFVTKPVAFDDWVKFMNYLADTYLTG